MFAKNSEASFVYNGVIEFIKAWESGSKSKLTLQSRNGQAWLNFNCYLGGPHDQHQKMKKPKSKSKKKQERDNLRAQLHQQRLQDEVSSTRSSSNFSKSNLEEKAVSASRATNDLKDPEQVQAAPAFKTASVTLDVSDSLNETNKMVENKTSHEFQCDLCDFVSSKAAGLNIHMSRKHTTIEQLDGAADEDHGQKVSEDEESDWDPSTDPDYELRTFLSAPYFKDGRIDLRNGEIVGRYVETEWVRKTEPRKVPSDVLPLKSRNCFTSNIYMYK